MTKQKTFGNYYMRLIMAVALPLGGGFLVSLLTRSAMSQFNSFQQPPLAPPAWLFPVAWSLLYVCMGVASFIIYNLKPSKDRSSFLSVYLVHLGFNFLWTILFFNLGQLWLAFIWLMAMWGMIIYLVVKAEKLSTDAFILLLPYLAWTTFAAYLNICIAILN